MNPDPASPPPKVLLLIPAYNEERRIAPTLRRYADFFREHYPGRFDLVVIVNGCRDGTEAVVKQVEAECSNVQHRVIPDRVGKGGALIEGLKLATDTDVIGYADADGATAPESLLQLALLCRDYDAAIGSRRVAGAVIHQLQPSHRQLASKVFHVIVQSLFRMNIRDTQCGAKFLRQAAALKVHNDLNIADMAFDVNLLYALKRARCSMIEAPVDWTDHLGSTVSYFRTSLVMFLSVVRIRILHSPLSGLLRLARPIEARIYALLRTPPPRPLQPPTPQRNR
jgi:glycosyltransferase involved in cell wall biosynthesis